MPPPLRGTQPTLNCRLSIPRCSFQHWAGKNGWVDIDPTRGTIVEDHHVAIAVGRDYADVPPNRGVWRGRAEETMSVTVKVEPIERMPHDWSDWGIQSPWSASTWTQSRKLRNGRPMNLHPTAGYRQQQSQQQQ